MKKQQIKEELKDLNTYMSKMRVEEESPYYIGKRETIDFLTKELNFIIERI